MKLKQVGSEDCVKPHTLFKIIKEYIKRQLEHFYLLMNIYKMSWNETCNGSTRTSWWVSVFNWWFIVFIKFEKFVTIISSNCLFVHTFSFMFFWDFNYMRIHVFIHLILSHRWLRFFFCSGFILLLCFILHSSYWYFNLEFQHISETKNNIH